MLTTSLEVKQQLNKYPSLSRSQTKELKGLEEILRKLGLQLSPSDIDRLYCDKFVSLEHINLADLGTILILASAIASHNFQHKNISFRDLLMYKGTADCFGIPLYCWDVDNEIKYYLRLTFLTGSPALVIQNQVK